MPVRNSCDDWACSSLLPSNPVQKTLCRLQRKQVCKYMFKYCKHISALTYSLSLSLTLGDAPRPPQTSSLSPSVPRMKVGENSQPKALRETQRKL